MDPLFSPPRSKVTVDELYEEVAEYFELGVRVKPGDTVLDVGANIGAFALRAAEATGGDLRILAFEPSPETFMALAANFEANETLRRTTHRLFHLGLSSDERAGERLSFYDFARFPTNSTFHLSAKRREFEIFFEERGRRIAAAVPGPGHVVGLIVSLLPKGPFGWWLARKIMGLERHAIRVETLAHVLAEEAPFERIDLLKIDVEGPELDILRGIDEPTWSKVQQVVLETHDRDGRLTEIKAELKRHGLGVIRKALQKTVDNGLESIVLYATRHA
jgi:FkbM family methyltransferase